MLVVIVDLVGNGLSQRTQDTFASVWPGCRYVTPGRNPAEELNRALLFYEEPIFIVLEAGDAVTAEFPALAGRWLSDLRDDAAGVVVLPPHGDSAVSADGVPRGPLLWRTAAVRDGLTRGFAARDMLPFERYVLLDKKLQLDAGWSWAEVRSDALRASPRRWLRWQKTEREWAYLSPILAGRPAPPLADQAPYISIVICTYNDADYLLWAIRSVCVQTFAAWELIIVDDGSTDHTAAALRQTPLLRDPRIRVLRNATNQGKSHCLNAALSAARGEWLLELDADDWLAPDCAATMAHDAAAADEAGMILALHAEWRETSKGRTSFVGISRSEAEQDVRQLLDRPFPLAPRMYRTSLLRQLGGWLTTDPYEGRLYEDMQMLVRIARQRPVVRIPKALYHRRIRVSSMTQRHKAWYAPWRAWMKNQIGQGQDG